MENKRYMMEVNEILDKRKEMLETMIMVDDAIKLDKRQKEDKKKLDRLKSKLQTIGLSEMENTNRKYIEYFGNQGSCITAYKEKLEVDNFPELKDLTGSVIEGKYKVETTTKITIDDNKFKSALIALYKNNFKSHDIPEVLKGLGIVELKDIKVAQTKLKGDYIKDKSLLESLGAEGKMEEELDAIKENINYELVSRYFETESIDFERLRKAIFVEDTLSIGFSYEE